MTEHAHSMGAHGCVTGAKNDNVKERYKRAENDSGGDGSPTASTFLENGGLTTFREEGSSPSDLGLSWLATFHTVFSCLAISFPSLLQLC